jgi:hypothetical protein
MKLYEREVQGDNLGFIFKDYEAYLKGDEVCYISELATELSTLTEEEAREVGYTRFQLEALCEPYNLDTDYLFEMLDWQSPEVLIDEILSNIANDEMLGEGDL